MMCPQSTTALLPEVVQGAVYPERVMPTLPWLDACAQRAAGPIARRWRSRLWAGHEFVERVSGLAITYERLKEPEFQPAAETMRAALVKQVSGSRYYRDFRQDTPAPSDRRFINATITREINERYGLNLTDAFCGFKAYRRSALEKLRITERGWGMPLQLWVQAARQGLRVKEIGVPRLYLDPNRAFGGVMNDPEQRLAYYRGILAAAEQDELEPVSCSERC